jgi:hypothetical protein
LNLIELWYGLSPKFGRILGALDKIQKDIDAVQVDLMTLKDGQLVMQDTIDAMDAKIDRIEAAVGGGGDAVTLTVVVGTPTEQ